MKILLTGATGFVGSHVARHLVRQGHEVHALIRPTSDTGRIRDLLASLRIVSGDVLEGLGDVRPEACIHLAWNVEPGKYLNAPHNLDFLSASLNLAKTLAASGCKRFVAAGTCFEYDASFGVLSETTPTRPTSLYAASKLALSQVLERFCPTVNMEFAWTRFFYLYGPTEDRRRLFPHVINALRKGEPARLTPGEQVRDFLHVEDVAAAVCAVAESRATGAVNIGSAQPVTVREIALKIGELLGRPDLVKLGAQPYPPGEPMRIVADNSRLRSLGWQPRFDLDSGLRLTVDWWKTQA